MASGHRILFTSEPPLTESAQTFLSRSSIDVDFLPDCDVAELAPTAFDLIILEEGATEGELGETLSACAQRGLKLLVLSDEVPNSAYLEMAEAFLVAPYSQSDLIGAIGDLLGTELRRALRMPVNLPVKVGIGKRTSDATIVKLSETGCLLDVDTSIHVGESVTLSFVLPSNREELSLGGTVVSGNERQLLYGVRFDDGFQSERLAILVFVELGLAEAGQDGRGEHQV